MKFEAMTQERKGGFRTIKNKEAYEAFCKTYQPTGACFGSPLGMSAALLKKKLIEGQENLVEPDSNPYVPEDGEISDEMNGYYHRLFDHCSLWKNQDGKIFVISFPYGTKEEVEESFRQFKQQFDFPESVSISFLDPEMFFRPNGDWMVLIENNSDSNDNLPECFSDHLEYEAENAKKAERMKSAQVGSLL